jgi:tRNA modification GTPase
MSIKDTITAIATPPGTSSVAMVRISGPEAIKITDKVFRGSKALNDLKGYEAVYGNIVAISTEEMIDEVVALVYRSPHSFTGEDTVEIMCHGNTLIASLITDELVQAGAIPARPGEFTQLAFLNGRLDLAQAEAVADMISASSKASLKLAVSQLKGGVSQKITELRSRLLELTSLLELELDFSEEDVEFANRDQLRSLLEESIHVASGLSDTFSSGNAIKDGILVTIAGKPNAGKSTLLNALLSEERAIVSDIAGTTRDTIEESITIGGVLFRFADTAGIRETTDKVEIEGVKRAYKKISDADVVLYVFDITDDTYENVLETLNSLNSNTPDDVPVIPLANKTDVGPAEIYDIIPGILKISAKKGDGMDELVSVLHQKASTLIREAGDVAITNIRHKKALDEGVRSLERALKGIREDLTTDLLASEIRGALFHFGEITGEVTTDEVLGNIFSRFCIGK